MHAFFYKLRLVYIDEVVISSTEFFEIYASFSRIYLVEEMCLTFIRLILSFHLHRLLEFYLLNMLLQLSRTCVCPGFK